MIYHTVLFKLSERATAAQVDEMLLALNTLPGLIDEIQFLQAEKNISERSNGHEVVLVSRFADKSALNAYSKHPDHQKAVKDKVTPIVESVIVGDIEF